MKLKLLVLLIVALSACSVAPSAPNAGALPWTFNGLPASGYSIALITVDPAPGTALVAGHDVVRCQPIRRDFNGSTDSTI